jgi:guanosine-3',5'-bis(diphosphate) 3'-pyrophosphohydrolase
VARVLLEEAGIDDPEVLAAAILHDTVEDTDATPRELMNLFGTRVAAIVAEVTDDKELPKLARKQAQVEHAASISTEAQLIKLADKLSNLRDVARRAPQGWDAATVRGYFCWANEVVGRIGNINAALWRRLEEVFAGEVTVQGATFRAVPADESERAAVLRDYYAAMSRARD